jgi:hypothetical protein
MGTEDEFRAAIEQVLDRGNHSLDAGIVGDLTVLERHVEIHAHQDFFGGDV